MRLPRFTTRRLMVLVAVVALLTWLVILCRPFFQHSSPDPFDAVEMLGSVLPDTRSFTSAVAGRVET
jgi:hypothetical protein